MKRYLLVVLGLLAAPSADADTCKRWENHMNPCDGVVAQDVCGDSSLWSPNQWINYKNWLYSSSAADACRKYVMKAVDPDVEWALMATWSPDIFDCYWDNDDDGVDDDDWSENRTTVSRTDVQKDECCSRVPNGRYKDSVPNETTPSTGGEFSSDMRKKILQRNGHSTTTAKSDAHYAGMIDPGAGLNGILDVTSQTLTASDDPMTVTKTIPPLPPSPNGLANIDHIIPRIDSNGCPCGTDSTANAAVISSQMNTSMGRSCLDHRRVAFLNTWTLPAGSARVAPENDSASSCGPEGCDAADAVDPAGGCTATPGDAGLLMLALGGLFVVGRRRRK